MKRTVSHDGNGALVVRFPFDRGLVDRIKSLPNRRWNAAERFWWVPDTDAVLLVDLLDGERFAFDEETVSLYRRYGGEAKLDSAEAQDSDPQRSAMRSLFDELVPAAVEENSDYTVSQLNERVNEVIESAFPAPVWVVGEISNFNKNRHRKHVSFELADRSEDGRSLSKIPATLFERTRREIERRLERAGNPFALEDEVTVRMLVRVELYVPWGQYRVVVDDVDLNYTLGEAARRREEIVRKLTAEGLVGVNQELTLPRVPLRLALITSLGSDAYNDVVKSLQESGFSFAVTAHGARVQGHQTENSVLNALDWIRARTAEFDAVLICRGGGSRTDLVWFDTEALGRAVATFPLPVLVGIGHEQDRSVLDSVARSYRTPTATAERVVEAVRSFLEQVDERSATILARATRQLSESTSSILERARRTAAGTRSAVRAARERLRYWSEGLPRSARARIRERRLALDRASHGLIHAARGDLGMARQRLDRQSTTLGPVGRRQLERSTERLASRSHRLRLVHPRSIIERGYAILRDEGGRIVQDASTVPAGKTLRAELKQGRLKLRSEGAEPDQGD